MSYLSYRPFYYLTHPHELVSETYYEIKWFIQRGKRGWSDSDVWSFDDYLSRVICQGIRKLRKSPWLGCPVGFLLVGEKGDDESVPVSAIKQLTCGDSCDKDDKRFEEWNQMLGRIASGFEVWIKRDEWFDTEEWEEYLKLPTNKEQAEMSTRKDKEAYDKLQESLELFKKYFVNLWD